MRLLTPERQAILDAMQSDLSYTPSEIAFYIRKERTSVTHMMQKMLRSGHLTQISFGQYVKVDHEVRTTKANQN